MELVSITNLGAVLGMVGALVSVATLVTGYFSLRTTARSSYLDELRKELDLLRGRVKEAEKHQLICEAAIETLKAENRSLMMEILKSALAKAPP